MNINPARFFLFIVLLIAVRFTGSAQPANRFQKLLHESPVLNKDFEERDIQATRDGGFIICGTSTYALNATYDIALIKTDGSGNVQWMRTYDSGQEDDALSVDTLPGGAGYIMACSYNSGLSTYYGSSAIICVDAAGNVKWANRTTISAAKKVLASTTGGYWCVSREVSSGQGGVFIQRVDTAGTIAWQKDYTLISSISGQFDPVDAVETSDGGLVVLCQSSIQTHPSVLLKVSATGTLVWSNRYDFSPSGMETPLSVTELPNTDLIFTGSFSSDFFFARLKANGDTAGARVHTNSDAVGEQVYYNRADSQLYFGGTYGQYSIAKLFIARADTTGAILSAKKYTKYNVLSGHFTIAGKDKVGCAICDFAGPRQTYFVRSDSTGTSGCFESYLSLPMQHYRIFRTQIGIVTQQLHQAQPLTIAPVSCIAVADSICESCAPPIANFNHGVNINVLTYSDLQSGGTSYYWDFGDGNHSSFYYGTHTYTAPGTYIVCFAATNECGSDTICDTVTISTMPGIASYSRDIAVNLYPNPAQEYVRLDFGETAFHGTISVTDIFGRTMYTAACDTKQFGIPLSGFSEGVYFLSIRDEENKMTKVYRFIKSGS